MSNNEELRNQKVKDDHALGQNSGFFSLYDDLGAMAIERLLPSLDGNEYLEITLHASLMKLKEWNAERWSRARPQSVDDEINVDEPNQWLSQYPAEKQKVVSRYGKNEANNPINRFYNEKLVELSSEWDGIPLDEHEEHRDGAQFQFWADLELPMFVHWRRYIDSGLAGRLSLNEFREAYHNMIMIFIRELVEIRAGL